MSQFGITEIQADDILEIRLRHLARVGAIRIEKEMKEGRVRKNSAPLSFTQLFDLCATGSPLCATVSDNATNRTS